ncbi:MAG: LPS biosynthesis protein WbpP [Gemmatimonadetes bacterium]|nr:MAG: LPS biosynthesis protein WbpP [Gemmatimonadota bacterium]
MRCLITGGAGFIGSHLVEHLVAAGHDVVVLDDLSTGRRENLAAVRRRVCFMRGSVADLNTCRRAMEGVDYVLHHAAVTSVPRSVNDPGVAHTVNATGTMNVLLAARDARVRRVVYAGSTSVYGNSMVLPNSEDHVANPLGPYAASKLAGEGYCLAFHAAYGLDTVVLRYFNIFGPRQDPNSPYAAVVPRFIAAALAGEPPTIYGDGSQTRDFVYVANVVRANLLAAQAPAARVAGQVFNVGCGRSVSVNELWDRVRALTGVPVLPRREAARAGEVQSSLASIAKARDLVGYRPEVDFDEGLRRTIAFCREARRSASQLGRRRGTKSARTALRLQGSPAGAI